MFKLTSPSIALVMLAPTALLAGDLMVDVSDIRNSEGQVRVALHDGANGFPSKRVPIAVQSRVVGSAVLRFVFADLPTGNYAVTLFHDEDGNGELNTSLVGLPIEGFGFSNDAIGQFGPPSFEDSQFSMPDTDHSISISVAY